MDANVVAVECVFVCEGNPGPRIVNRQWEKGEKTRESGIGAEGTGEI